MLGIGGATGAAITGAGGVCGAGGVRTGAGAGAAGVDTGAETLAPDPPMAASLPPTGTTESLGAKISVTVPATGEGI